MPSRELGQAVLNDLWVAKRPSMIRLYIHIHTHTHNIYLIYIQRECMHPCKLVCECVKKTWNKREIDRQTSKVKEREREKEMSVNKENRVLNMLFVDGSWRTLNLS